MTEQSEPYASRKAEVRSSCMATERMRQFSTIVPSAMATATTAQSASIATAAMMIFLFIVMAERRGLPTGLCVGPVVIFAWKAEGLADRPAGTALHTSSSGSPSRPPAFLAYFEWLQEAGYPRRARTQARFEEAGKFSDPTAPPEP